MVKRLARVAIIGSDAPLVAPIVLTADVVFSQPSTSTLDVPVLDNDHPSGDIRITSLTPTLPLPADHISVIGTAPNQKIQINRAGLDPGTYSATYNCALISDPSITGSGTITLTIQQPAGTIDASADTLGNIALDGTFIDLDVLPNDTGSGDIRIVSVTANSPLPQGNLSIVGTAPHEKIRLNLSGLTAGDRSFSYTVALVSDSTVTDSATASFTLIVPDSVDAQNITGLTHNVGTGNYDIPVLNSVTASGPVSLVLLTASSPLPATALSIQGTAPNQFARVALNGLAAGSYSFSYKAALTSNTAVNDTATVSFALNNVVDAVNNTGIQMQQSTAGFNIDVLAGDSGSGTLEIVSATTTDSRLPQANLSLTGTIGTDQKVRVDRSGLTVGTGYTFTYLIRIQGTTAPTDSAQVTFDVVAVAAGVAAGDDTYSLNKSTSTIDLDVLDNDTITGGGTIEITTVTSSNATKLPQNKLSIVGTVGSQKIRVNRNGLAAASGYAFTYRIRKQGDDTINDTATVTFSIVDRPVFNLNSTKRVILYQSSDSSFTGTKTRFSEISDQLTYTVFVGSGQWPEPAQYDHSSSGLDTYATNVWNEFISNWGDGTLAGNPKRRIFWWDWEENRRGTRTSKNVPASVNYVASKDHYHAAFYETSVPPGDTYWDATAAHGTECRIEAARFCSELARRLVAKAEAAGIVGFEQISYTHPDQPVSQDAASQTTRRAGWTSQFNQISDWMSNYMLGGSIPCYYNGDITRDIAAFKDDHTHWTDKWRVRIADQRATFGTAFKIIPTLWARWYPSNNSETQTDFPNNSFCVPADFMTAAFDAVMESGADGFSIYLSGNHGTGSNTPPTNDVENFRRAHGEIVDRIKSDTWSSKFVGIRYS